MSQRRDKDHFWEGGPYQLREGIKEEKRAKLKAIVEKLRQEQDPEERGKLLQRYGEVMRTSDEEVRKIKDYVF